MAGADILVLNAGSSSIKTALFERAAGAELSLRLTGNVEGIGTSRLHAVAHDAAGKPLLDESWTADDGPHDHGAALARILGWLRRNEPDWRPAAVGHRVVHGGSRYQAP